MPLGALLAAYSLATGSFILFVLERVAAAAPGAPRGEQTRQRVTALRAEIEAAEKSRRWKLRERIGRRKRWSEAPEELIDE